MRGFRRGEGRSAGCGGRSSGLLGILLCLFGGVDPEIAVLVVAYEGVERGGGWGGVLACFFEEYLFCQKVELFGVFVGGFIPVRIQHYVYPTLVSANNKTVMEEEEGDLRCLGCGFVFVHPFCLLFRRLFRLRLGFVGGLWMGRVRDRLAHLLCVYEN